ncbi:MAG: peptide/nickel transport system permease protein [Thermomicrobiales bacterium]|jgi:peptide/nickel transport system permease protein|nr:peptide/nickel transport system permease protein [Thermomicrobiales bacterium]MEA2527376.1 peptide/nickel transport system permease protein [Thermomicrobiales bacterium]
MGRYLLRRLVIAVPILFGISLTTFALGNVAPGDPVTAMLDPKQMANLGPEWVEQRKEALGLNKPAATRYVIWLKELSRGNLGYSYQDGQPVWRKISERIWPTLLLMSTVLIMANLIGIPLGLLAAVKQYSVFDYAASLLGFAAVSIPSFFLGLGFIYIFSVQLRWLPTAGMNSVGGSKSFIDSLEHIILPATTLGLAQAAPLIRYSRASMLESIHQDYIAVARAKGLSERTVMFRHALRNVLNPLVTIIALDLPALLGGTVIIEQIFAWPGMGTLAVASVFGRDYPVIMGITLLGAVTVVASNLLADLVYAVVDPRIKYS